MAKYRGFSRKAVKQVFTLLLAPSFLSLSLVGDRTRIQEGHMALTSLQGKREKVKGY